MSNNLVMDKVAREWLAARNIIAAALSEWYPPISTYKSEMDAAAILARLAHHKPPLLICQDKEDDQ